MPITTTTSDQTLAIAVRGRFDFTEHEAFRQAYERHPRPSGHYLVDLSATDYMDSSALGMLLLLRRHAGDGAAPVRIAGAKPEIRRILSIANFQKLFQIG